MLLLNSSSRQILYSYEIFLVLSAIYFTYTVLKLPSDAQFFFWPHASVYTVQTGKSKTKKNDLKKMRHPVLFCIFFVFCVFVLFFSSKFITALAFNSFIQFILQTKQNGVTGQDGFPGSALEVFLHNETFDMLLQVYFIAPPVFVRVRGSWGRGIQKRSVGFV